MKLYYTLIIIFFTCLNSIFSQNVYRNFKGRVIDSTNGQPLPDASVCIYRASDTSLLNFGFTTPNGNFSLTSKNGDSLIIIISLFGYNERIIKKEKVDNWDFNDYGDIKLSVMPVSFKGVSIRSAAIRMKGDTIEINASRFKVLPGSDVAQLFKKIPGFEVNVKGEIKVNGSSVTKIMVDGSDFFGNNPGMVSKNLSADMIETVQVFEDVNDDGSPKQQSSKVINLKLKKGKRNGLFGDAKAGYGTRDRYEAGLRLNSFKNDRKFSFILNGNNTNETGFDFGFENWHFSRAEQKNGGSTNDDINMYSSGSGVGEGNINNKLNSGFTYFNEFSKKRKLTVNLSGNWNKYNSINSSRAFNAFNDSTFRTNLDSSNMNGLATSGAAEIYYSKTIDSTGSYEVGLTVGSGNDRNTTNNFNTISINNVLLNKGISTLLNTSDKNEVGVNANLKRSLRKNARYQFTLSGSYGSKNAETNSFQFLENSTDTFNNLSERSTRVSEYLVKLSGKMPLYKKYNLGLSLDRWQQNNSSVQNSRSAQNNYSNLFEQAYQERIDTLSTKLDNRMEQYTFKPYLNYTGKKLYSSAGITLMQFNMWNQVADSAAINTSYQKALPYFFVSYYPTNYYIYFMTSKSTTFPTVSELIPIQNISNNYQRQAGNKNLRPQDNYNVNLYCGFYKIKGFKYLYSSINGSISDNAKILVNRQSADGVVIQTPENASGQKKLSSWVAASKTLTKIIAVNLNLRQDFNRNPLIINNQKAFGTNNSNGISGGFSFSKTDSLDFYIGMGYNYSDYKNTLNESLNYKQNTFSYSANIRALIKTGTEISSSLEISDQRNVPSIGKLIPIWNAYIQHPLTRNGKYNLKLTAYDILKRNTSISRFASNNYIYISQNNQLQQYFMLTLIYKIKKVGGEEDPFNFVE